MTRLANCAALLALLAPAGCQTLFPGFSIVPPEEPLRPPVVIDAAARLASRPVGDPSVVPLLTDAPRSSCAFVVIQGEVPPHVHEKSDETVYILEGEGDVLLDGEWRAVRAGQLIHVPMNVPHAYVNRAPGGSTVLSTYTPPFTAGDRVPVASVPPARSETSRPAP